MPKIRLCDKRLPVGGDSRSEKHERRMRGRGDDMRPTLEGERSRRCRSTLHLFGVFSDAKAKNKQKKCSLDQHHYICKFINAAEDSIVPADQTIATNHVCRAVVEETNSIYMGM